MNNEVTQDEVDSKVLHKLYELETSDLTSKSKVPKKTVSHIYL